MEDLRVSPPPFHSCFDVLLVCHPARPSLPSIIPGFPSQLDGTHCSLFTERGTGAWEERGLPLSWTAGTQDNWAGGRFEGLFFPAIETAEMKGGLSLETQIQREGLPHLESKTCTQLGYSHLEGSSQPSKVLPWRCGEEGSGAPQTMQQFCSR